MRECSPAVPILLSGIRSREIIFAKTLWNLWLAQARLLVIYTGRVLHTPRPRQASQQLTRQRQIASSASRSDLIRGDFHFCHPPQSAQHRPSINIIKPILQLCRVAIEGFCTSYCQDIAGVGQIPICWHQAYHLKQCVCLCVELYRRPLCYDSRLIENAAVYMYIGPKKLSTCMSS